ncbi:MAG: hypothetical protein U5J95_06210 [Balneolaceae bacterium]|nr:hypothetical protein [Balneolaceae bacterium]
MSNYKLLYLIWLLPAAFLFLIIHQAAVFYGIVDTYDNGTSYTAEVVDFELKQIAAQTNGYIVLKFNTSDGNQVQQKLSLPVEMAGNLQEIRVIPIRYQKGAFQNIVMMPTYSTQKGLILTNLAMAAVGFLIALFITYLVHKYVGKKLSSTEEKLVIERVDHDD